MAGRLEAALDRVVAATGRPVAGEVMTAVANTFTLAMAATLMGFALGGVLGFVAGYFRDSWIDRVATTLSIVGVSVPHYWLGMVLVIVFSSQLGWLPATGAGPGGSGQWAWDWAHLKYLVLPAITTSVIPMGIVTRTVRALTGDILSQDFVDAFNQCDVILGPTSPGTAFKIGEKSGDPLQMYLSDIYTIAVNLAGLPGMSLPCGFDRANLPVGMQLIGRAFDEATLFRAGHAYQQATDWHRQTPG